jgi:SP family general alpha glucoside:H+ symporter-like MFS transporter
MVLLWVFTYDFTVGPLACRSKSAIRRRLKSCLFPLDCIVGEVSSTRLRSKTVGLARNGYNVVGIVAGVLNTYMMNPLAVSLSPKVV